MAENKDEYNLYTEKIKLRPGVKYRKLFYIIKVGALALFAGALCGLSFVTVTSLADFRHKSADNNRQEITFTEDEYPEIPEDMNSQDLTAPVSEDVRNNDEKDSLQQMDIFDKVREISLEIEPSLVTVTAINQGEDLLSSVIQTRKQIPGVIIADNELEYLILTDYGVGNVDYIKVTFMDNSEINATLVAEDKTLDMAVVAVSHEDVPLETAAMVKIATMGNSYMLKHSELVVAVGNLYGINSAVDFGTTVSTKEIVYETDSRHSLIYTNMSGVTDCSGFIFNDEGQLVGDISSEYSNKNIVAYGISDIKIRLQNLTNGKKIGYLGIVGRDVTEKIAAGYEGMPAGVYVASVENNSPAYFSGIQNGDIIVDINGRNIANVYNVERAMCEFVPDTQVKVTVYRLGREGYVPIVFTINLSEK